MQINEATNQNQLRQVVRAAWNANRPMVIKAEDGPAALAACRTFSTELGARFIPLQINTELTEEQRALLNRPGPRLVALTGLETMSAEALQDLPAACASGGRALPIVLCIEPPADPTPDEAIAA